MCVAVRSSSCSCGGVLICWSGTLAREVVLASSRKLPKVEKLTDATLREYEERGWELDEDGHGQEGRPLLELVAYARHLRSELRIMKLAAEIATPEAVVLLRKLVEGLS